MLDFVLVGTANYRELFTLSDHDQVFLALEISRMSAHNNDTVKMTFLS